MAQFKALNPNVEVNGQTVLSIAHSLGSMQTMGMRYLENNGLKNIKPDKWYPQQDWLNAFKSISEEVGSKTLYKIGASIPDNAQFPEDIDSIFKALAAIDVAYHMNHRIKNIVLFNPSTGKMEEGIGHYHFKKVDERKVEIKCDNPYPCEFDKGIIERMANRFRPRYTLIRFEHKESDRCRKNGDNACLYTVSW